MARRAVRLLVCVLMIAGVFAWPVPKTRAATYTVAEVGALKGDVFSIAYAINADGVAVGHSTDEEGVSRAVRLRDGALRDLAIDGHHTYASGIDQDLVVVGSARELGPTRQEDGATRAVVWEKSKPRDLPSLGGDKSQALAINGKSVIVGYSTIEPGLDAVTTACRWQDGEIEDLGTLGGYSVANDVNDRGWIVGGANTIEGAGTLSPGGRAVLWRDGELIDLGALPGGEIAQARSVNEHGQIAGYSTTGPDQQFSGPGMHAFLWEDGEFTDLGPLPGAEISLAFAINERGQVVGYAHVAGEPSDQRFGYAAVLWEDGVIVNLNDLIPAASGWVLIGAFGINDAGQIVGTGYLNGEQRGFVLTPV